VQNLTQQAFKYVYVCVYLKHRPIKQVYIRLLLNEHVSEL